MATNYDPNYDPMFDDPADYTDFSGTKQFIPALATLIGVSAQTADIKSRSDATLRQIDSETEAYKFKQNVQQQRLKDLERAVGDKLSSNGLEDLKRESRLKAVGAETGSTTVAEELVGANSVNTLHANAAVLRSYEVNKSSMMQQMVGESLSFENRLEGLTEGMQSPLSAFLQTLNVGMGSFGTGLSYLNTTEKEEFFGTQTS